MNDGEFMMALGQFEQRVAELADNPYLTMGQKRIDDARKRVLALREAEAPTANDMITNANAMINELITTYQHTGDPFDLERTVAKRHEVVRTKITALLIAAQAERHDAPGVTVNQAGSRIEELLLADRAHQSCLREGANEYRTTRDREYLHARINEITALLTGQPDAGRDVFGEADVKPGGKTRHGE